MTEQKQIPVSVYVITKNEEENIVGLLNNHQNFAEVIIVDSGSTDRTLELAASYPNTKISINEWPGFSEQKAHALSLCRFPWVLILDADETLSDTLIDELISFIKQDHFVALRCKRILLRWGRQPRSFGKAEKLIRLFEKESGHYESRQVHESISISGPIKETGSAHAPASAGKSCSAGKGDLTRSHPTCPRDVDYPPGQAGDGGGQGHPEFAVVTGVVVTTGEVEAGPQLQVGAVAIPEVHPIAAVVQSGITTPGHPICGLIEITGAICLIEKERLLQCLGVTSAIANHWGGNYWGSNHWRRRQHR